jgi:hypothetical protein
MAEKPNIGVILARLSAMQGHVPDIVDESFVEEFNGLVNEAENLRGEDLSACRIAGRELRSVSRLSYMNDFHAETYTKVYGPPECDRDLFLRRLDALLNYLVEQPGSAGRTVGFR